ncbi:MAG TPA: hypothetical protein VK630_15925 [Reyranella sp.]|nr:hypothetical protein [Reyranella sp.]
MTVVKTTPSMAISFDGPLTKRQTEEVRAWWHMNSTAPTLLREIADRMRSTAPSLRGVGQHASDASFNRQLRDAARLEVIATELERRP